MKLIRNSQVINHGDFAFLFQEAKTGDLILLYSGEYDGWCNHPRGVMIQRNSLLLLNGKEQPDFALKRIEQPRKPLRRGNQYFVGNTLVYQGTCDEYYEHQKGIVIRNENQFLLAVYKPSS